MSQVLDKAGLQPQLGSQCITGDKEVGTRVECILKAAALRADVYTARAAPRLD